MFGYNQLYGCPYILKQTLEFERCSIVGLEKTFAYEGFQKKLKRYSFHIALLACFTLPICLLMVLDFLNIESFTEFNRKFVFEETWKGRMFYLFFIWLFFIESIIDWGKIVERKPTSRFRILACFLCAFVPTVYVLAVNFVSGVNQTILDIGKNMGIVSGFLPFHWVLSFEYLIFVIFFATTIVLAYKKDGLKTFSISLSLLGGMASAYMIDTIYPFGLFTPLQLFALPTAASTAAFLELLGYKASLGFPALVHGARLPYLEVTSGDKLPYGAYVGWPCAGVHSLLLYVLIILVFFKRSEISGVRKVTYFIIGAFGTYFVNVLRIYGILITGLNYGDAAATVFHNTYGELFFFTWIFSYILLIVCIQRFMLVEKIRSVPSRLGSLLTNAKKRLGSLVAKAKKKIVSSLKAKFARFKEQAKN